MNKTNKVIQIANIISNRSNDSAAKDFKPNTYLSADLISLF